MSQGSELAADGAATGEGTQAGYEPPTETASGTPRVPALDGLRAYAILAIVGLHLLAVSGVMGEAGGTTRGVVLWSIFSNNIDAFFMISGFVLFLPTVARRGVFGSRAAFWIGRGARLLPAYWLVLSLCLLLIVFAPPFAEFPFPPLHSVITHFTATHTPARLIDPTFAHGFGIDGPVWMISIVISFYLLLPLIARSYYRHPIIGLGIAAAITVAWKEAINRTPEIFERLSEGGVPLFAVRAIPVDQLPGWVFSFGLGMTGAWAFMRLRERYSSAQLARAALWIAPAAVALYAFGAYLYGSTTLEFPNGVIGTFARADTFETMLGSLGRAAVIGVVILAPAWLQRPFVNRLTGRLAELSYGVYLIHLVIITYAANVLGLTSDGSIGALALWVAIVMPLSLLWAAFSRRYVEQPIQRWVRQRRSLGARPASPPQPEV